MCSYFGTFFSFLSSDKFKGGKAELKQTKSCVDVSELMDLLSARDYEKYEIVEQCSL